LLERKRNKRGRVKERPCLGAFRELIVLFGCLEGELSYFEVIEPPDL
jgi:hypothetical protein